MYYNNTYGNGMVYERSLETVKGKGINKNFNLLGD
jgi:hypothetical protein